MENNTLRKLSISFGYVDHNDYHYRKDNMDDIIAMSLIVVPGLVLLAFIALTIYLYDVKNNEDDI